MLPFSSNVEVLSEVLCQLGFGLKGRASGFRAI